MKKNILVVSFIFFSLFISGQTKIEQSRRELKAEKPKKEKKLENNNNTNQNTDNDSSSTIVSDIIGNAFELGESHVFYDLFVFTIIGDYKDSTFVNYRVTPYPFFKPKIGNYYNISNEPKLKRKIRIDGSVQFMHGKDLTYGNHFDIKIIPFEHFNLQADAFRIYENQKNVNSTDQFTLFYFNLGYDSIREESFNFGWTLGASYVGEDIKKAGFSYGLNMDAFCKKTVSFNANAKWSSINKYPVNSYSFNVKYHYKKIFGSLGYQHLKIATPTYNFATLGFGIYL
jgi:hypothetical protein